MFHCVYSVVLYSIPIIMVASYSNIPSLQKQVFSREGLVVSVPVDRGTHHLCHSVDIWSRWEASHPLLYFPCHEMSEVMLAGASCH